MPSRNILFQMLPWSGGLNTSLDESMIPANQLTVADHLIFDTRGSRKKRDGIKYNWDSASDGATSIIGLHDYWYGATTRTQKTVGVASNRALYSYSGGTRTTLTDGGTAWSGTLAQVSMVTFNNKCIIGVDGGTGNVPKYWDGSSNVADLPGSPPPAAFFRVHLGRLFCNDKSNPDRLHYSPTADHTLWYGNGDSGAIDIGVGDGDPDGIVAIFPTFKGELFVAKRTKLYRVSGLYPEEWEVTLVSSGIGAINHNSVAPIDQDDIMWVSDKGVHSLQATQAFGDFESNYVSIDIQKTFNSGLSRSRLKYCWGAYLNTINSVAFAVTSSSGSTNDSIYLYNIPLKAWYRWPSVSCESMIVANDADKRRFYLGGATTRVAKTFNGTNYDVSSTGVSTAIGFRVTTGQIYPAGNPYSMVMFKRLILFFRPTGTYQLAATVTVDNFTLNSENSLDFSQSNSAALLGSTFVLGSSVLGSDVVLGPYSKLIDGHGRGCKIDISQTGIDQSIEIQGFALEFEHAGTSPEVVTR